MSGVFVCYSLPSECFRVGQVSLNEISVCAHISFHRPNGLGSENTYNLNRSSRAKSSKLWSKVSKRNPTASMKLCRRYQNLKHIFTALGGYLGYIFGVRWLTDSESFRWKIQASQLGTVSRSSRTPRITHLRNIGRRHETVAGLFMVTSQDDHGIRSLFFAHVSFSVAVSHAISFAASGDGV